MKRRGRPFNGVIYEIIQFTSNPHPEETGWKDIVGKFDVITPSHWQYKTLQGHYLPLVLVYVPKGKKWNNRFRWNFDNPFRWGAIPLWAFVEYARRRGFRMRQINDVRENAISQQGGGTGTS